jgi:hypothetical protein
MSKRVSVVPKHPETLRDASGKLVGNGPVTVDLADPFWRRLWKWKDIVPAPDAATTAKSATATAATAPAATAAPTAPTSPTSPATTGGKA